MTKVLALLGALAGLLRFAWLAKFVPGIGPFAAALSAVLDFLVALVKWFFEGLTVIFKNPVTFVTVGIIAMVAAGGGIKVGAEWTEHRVERAKAQFIEFKNQLRIADERAQQEVVNALHAREKAEQEAAAVANAAAAGRLRGNAARASVGASQ